MRKMTMRKARDSILPRSRPLVTVEAGEEEDGDGEAMVDTVDGAAMAVGVATEDGAEVTEDADAGAMQGEFAVDVGTTLEPILSTETSMMSITITTSQLDTITTSATTIPVGATHIAIVEDTADHLSEVL